MSEDNCAVPRFTMYAGDDRVLNFLVTDENGDDVTIDESVGAIFALFSADDKTEVFRVTLEDYVTLAGNVVTVNIPAADTVDLPGEYLFELQIEDSSNLVHTLAQGTATVKERLIHD